MDNKPVIVKNRHEELKANNTIYYKRQASPAGNRTPVSRVTGGDTHHYTTEDVRVEMHFM